MWESFRVGVLESDWALERRNDLVLESSRAGELYGGFGSGKGQGV